MADEAEEKASKEGSKEGSKEDEDEDADSDAESSEGPYLVPVAGDGVILPDWDDIDRIMVIGGMAEADKPLSSTEIIDLEKDEPYEWTAGPALIRKRWGCQAMWITDKYLIVIGGFGGGHYLNDSEVFNAETVRKDGGVFVPGPTMLQRRAGFAAVRVEPCRFMVIGGYGHDSCEVLFVPDPVEVEIDIYEDLTPRSRVKAEKAQEKAKKDGKPLPFEEPEPPIELTPIEYLRELSFQAGPKLRGPRACPAAVMIDDKRLWVIGGYDRMGVTSDTEIFDLETCIRAEDLFEAWTEEGVEQYMKILGGKCKEGTMCTFEQLQKLCETRGKRDPEEKKLNPFLSYEDLIKTELLTEKMIEVKPPPIAERDFTAGKFLPGPFLLCKRAAACAVKIDEARILIIGGFDGVNRLKTTELLDIATMTMSPGPTMHDSRAGCSAIMFEEEKLLIVGGCKYSDDDLGGCLDTTEVLDIEDVETNEELQFVPGPKMQSKRAYCALVPWVMPEEEAQEEGEEEEPKEHDKLTIPSPEETPR